MHTPLWIFFFFLLILNLYLPWQLPLAFEEWSWACHCSSSSLMLYYSVYKFLFFLPSFPTIQTCVSPQKKKNAKDNVIFQMIITAEYYVMLSSVIQSCPNLCDPMDRSTPGFPANHQLPGPTQTHVLCLSDAIQPSHPLSSLLLLPSIFPSIGVFSNESVLCIRWPKFWSVSFSISPSNEHPGLIFFRMDWLDLLAVQGTLKSLLQYHSSKASILQLSAFFIVQLSHPYMITGKTIALARWTFVGKVMSLLFNMLSWLVIAFLP